ncbi:MAG: hypothetical protein DPW18_08060 [Chloroflexi bacterium]|nr:hypothetical protein [Chloroflexota bacterium]MDL1942819.1 hypothetical protein [Chloroflexi bacterium CFX2]
MIAASSLLLAAILLAALTLIKRKSPARLREIPAFTRLIRTVGLSIEDGKRLHISLGHGNLLDARGGSAFAGLAMLRIIAERTSVSDMPSVASAGDPTLGLLTQDTIQAGYQAANVDELYVPTTGRVTGLTPFSYAAGAMHIAANESVSTNILTGHFGPEAGLLAESSDRDHVTLIGASDNLTGQAVLYVSAPDALIGEELFAAGAYLGSDPAHTASLSLQDILRWLVILALLGGAALKFVGVI